MPTLVEDLVAPDLAELIRSQSKGRRVWLVGGAIRDHFLDLRQPELDFAVDRDAIGLARQLADELKVACFVLDDERDAARVMLSKHSTLDFARLRASTIEADLRLRDFTVNAAAVDMADPGHLIDPLGGLQDIKDRVLRVCTPDSIDRDAIRALRAVRLASSLKLQFEDQSKKQVRAAAGALLDCAAERRRDEFSKMLDSDELSIALRLMRRLELLSAVLPEIAALSADTWDRSLRIVERLTDLLRAVARSYEADGLGNLMLAELSLRLGRFRMPLEEHLSSSLSGGHKVSQMLYLASIYAQVESGHQELMSRAQKLRFSQVEAARASTIVRNRDRASSLGEDVSELSIHRFYREYGEAGVDLVLLTLADSIARSLPQESIELRIDTARKLLEAWFEQHDRIVDPPRLVRGDQLAVALGLESGPIIGELLERIAEEQVEGRVQSKDDAIAIGRELIRERSRRE